MAVKVESTWMETQKHATVMSPGKDFQVVQATDGSAIFFSIGTDNVLYATREVTATKTGWNRIDLSSKLSGSLNSANVKVKAFCLSQNLSTMAFDLGMVLTVSGADQLFLSYGNSADPAAWADIQWRPIPFDEPGRLPPSPLIIDGVYLANLPSSRFPNGTQTCFVDIYQKPPASNPMKLLDRYYVSLKDAPFWHRHTLPIDLAAGSISNCLGRRENDRVGGIYTFGDIQNKKQLMYAPAYNEFDPGIPPRPSRLLLPTGASSIASAMNGDGKSNLFLSSDQGLYLFPPNGQRDESSGTLIVTSKVVANAIDLEAHSCGGTTGVFGVNPSGQLFYTHCSAGSEANAKAWSPPIALVNGIHHYSFFINAEAGNHTLFAHAKGQDVVQLTQDPVTTEWVPRQILLPGADINHVVKFNSFITKYQYQPSSAPQTQSTEVSISSTSPIGVYINEAYYVLKPTVPISLKLDATGLLTIVQPSETSSGVPYNFTISATGESTIHDPSAHTRLQLQGIKSVQDLDKATCKNADGSTSPLVPTGTSKEDKEALVEALKKFDEAAKKLPDDGSRLEATPSKNGPSPNATNIAHATIELTPGDFLQVVGTTLWEGIKSITTKIVDGIVHIVTEIGGAIYRAVLDCVSAIANAIEWVFNKVKVFVKDLIAWIGFIFNWKDIVRTHKVLKNVIVKYAKHSVSQISTIENSVANGLDGIDDKLREWSGLPDRGGKLEDHVESGKDGKSGYSNPQASWVGDQASSNVSAAQIDSKSKPAPEGWWAVLDELKKFVESEGDVVSKTIKSIKADIIEPYSSLTVTQVVQRLLGIIGSLVVQSAKHIVVAVLRIIRILADKVLDGLDEPIKIPVLSSLYKTIADEELSILDLICLVAAAPATIIYKAITNQTPFPDDSSTRALIDAPDYPAIQKLFSATDSDSTARLKSFCVVAEFAGMAGSWFLVLISKFKLPFVATNKPDDIPGFVFEITIPTRLLTLLPTIALGCVPESVGGRSWDQTMYHTMASIALFKTVLDASELGDKEIYLKVSPYIDYAIAAIWIVPAVTRLVKDASKDSSYVVLGRSLAGDFAQMLAPVVWNVGDPESRLIALAVTDGMCLVSAGLGIAAGKKMWDE